MIDWWFRFILGATYLWKSHALLLLGLRFLLCWYFLFFFLFFNKYLYLRGDCMTISCPLESVSPFQELTPHYLGIEHLRMQFLSNCTPSFPRQGLSPLPRVQRTTRERDFHFVFVFFSPHCLFDSFLTILDLISVPLSDIHVWKTVLSSISGPFSFLHLHSHWTRLTRCKKKKKKIKK